MEHVKSFEDFSNQIKEKTLTETLNYDFSEEDMMFEMSNLLPSRTGLDYQVWYSAYYPGHKPRIKVDLPDGKSVYIQIENHEIKGDVDKISSKELRKIFDWIDLNKNALLKYWNEARAGKIDTVEMNKLLKRIK